MMVGRSRGNKMACVIALYIILSRKSTTGRHQSHFQAKATISLVDFLFKNSKSVE